MKRTILALGTMALALALAGGAWAGKRYVITSSRQLKPHVLTLKNLSKRTVKRLHGAKGKMGATGAPGPKGDKGDTGQTGAPGLANVQADEPYGQDVDPSPNVAQSNSSVAAGGTQTVWVACPAGKTAIGGGFRIGDGGAGSSESDSPTQPDTAMRVIASEQSYYDASTGKLNLAAAPQVTSYGSYLPNAWAVTVHNDGASAGYARASVICAKVG